MLNNDTIQTPLPGDLQARVENALNLVTSLEAEHNRLQKMIGSQTQKINNNHEEIKSQEGKLKTLNSTNDGIMADIDKANSKLLELGYLIKDANHELEESTRKKIEIENDIVLKNDDLTRREQSVLEIENELQTRIEAHANDKQAHQKKVEKLLEALK